MEPILYLQVSLWLIDSNYFSLLISLILLISFQISSQQQLLLQLLLLFLLVEHYHPLNAASYLLHGFSQGKFGSISVCLRSFDDILWIPQLPYPQSRIGYLVLLSLFSLLHSRLIGIVVYHQFGTSIIHLSIFLLYNLVLTSLFFKLITRQWRTQGISRIRGCCTS